MPNSTAFDVRDLVALSIGEDDVSLARAVIAEAISDKVLVELLDDNEGENQIEIGGTVAITGWGPETEQSPSLYFVQRIVSTPATYMEQGEVDYVDVGEPYRTFPEALREALAEYMRQEVDTILMDHEEI